MPYTLNGIGTRYVGRGSLSTRNGTCAFCGRPAVLSFYDTREFFCFVFIPLIPLWKFRIQSDCSSCRRHHRIAWKEFQALVEARVGPLRADAERGRDPDPHVRLVEALADLQLFREAEAAATRGLVVAPDHGRLNALLGELLASRGDERAATPHLRKAVAASRDDAQGRLALGRNLGRLGLHDEAIRELDEALRLDPTLFEATAMLADRYVALGRHAEALQQLERLVSMRPELGSNRSILAQLKLCKETLGYPVSDAERKAARRWWPFGRLSFGRGVPAVSDWRKIGIAVGVLAAIFTVVPFGLAWWRQRHVPLYLDNALEVPVTVELDGEAIPLPPGPVVERTVPPGAHRLVTKGPKGEIERLDATVEARGFLDVLTEPRFYVYDVAAARIYRRERIGYSADEASRTYHQELIAFQTFFSQPSADFTFSGAPETVRVDSRQGSVTREAFSAARDVDYVDLGIARWDEGKKDDAEKAVRKAIQLRPCSGKARRNLSSILEYTERVDGALASAREWIADCPGVVVQAHRTYQVLMQGAGQGPNVAEEYRQRLAEHPDVAEWHYLYGRLLPEPGPRLNELREAIRLNPGLLWAHAGLGYDLLAREEHGEAFRELSTALPLTADEPGVAQAFAAAAVGAKEGPAAARTLTDLLRRSPRDEDADQALWLLQVATGEWDAAERSLRSRRQGGADPDETWRRALQLARLRGLDAEVDGLLDPRHVPAGLAVTAALARFEVALERDGSPSAVSRLESELQAAKGAVPPLYEFHEAASLLLAGGVEAGRAKAAALMATARSREPVIAVCAAELVGAVGPGVALDQARRTGYPYLRHAYFAGAVRARLDGNVARARELFERCAGSTLDGAFPLLLARRLTKE